MTTPRKKTPAPPPQSTHLDAIAAELDLKPYMVTWQGREWEFVHLQLLDTWDLTRDTEGVTSNEQILVLFELALGEQWEEFRQHPLPLALLQRLFADYTAYCGITPGK